MTHLFVRAAACAAASCLTLVLTSAADRVHAQCTTCATPTVAYSPVVAAAPVVAAPATVVVAPRMGLFDRLRLRRWGLAPTYTTAYAPAYTAAYAPTYTAGYAPAYTAAYAPSYTAAYAPSYTAAYAPAYTAAYAPAPAAYLTSYAPLQSPVVQTSYLPVAPAPSCSTCTTNYAPAPACSACTTNYAPTAVLSPVVVEQACTACSAAAPCGGCSACSAAAPVVESGYVGQAAYDAAIAAPAGCSSCAATSGSVQYNVPAGSSTGIGGGPATPPPGIPDAAAAPTTPNGPIVPYPEAGNGAFNAPQLLAPTNDRTASAPTVDIHTAVYRRPVGASSVSTAKPMQSAAPAVDATPWTAVTQ
jgi:hypothetical protein